ncbi:hypothetical protein GLYMA_18G180950v4 [Glycine max]|nr:hypothetical protein GLYMA_18G180950v4 [Glycine max]KAH1155011.1 hypothetical protein GYH30_050347 [Glycine max]
MKYIGIMKYMNLDAYRFSISWSRVLSRGKLNAGVNHEGVNYYNNLINELMANAPISNSIELDQLQDKSLRCESDIYYILYTIYYILKEKAKEGQENYYCAHA